MKVIGTSRIDDDSIRRIGRRDRRVLTEYPEGEPVERFGVGRRIGVLDQEARDEDLSLGRSHTYAQPGGLGSGVGRDHHPPSPVMADQDERRLTRRRRVAGLPPDSVG